MWLERLESPSFYSASLIAISSMNCLLLAFSNEFFLSVPLFVIFFLPFADPNVFLVFIMGVLPKGFAKMSFTAVAAYYSGDFFSAILAGLSDLREAGVRLAAAFTFLEELVAFGVFFSGDCSGGCGGFSVISIVSSGFSFSAFSGPRYVSTDCLLTKSTMVAVS